MEENVDVDAMMRFAGNFNRYQFLLIALFSAINVFAGFHYFGQTFIGVPPNFTCISSANSSVLENSCFSDIDKQVACTEGFRYTSAYDYKSVIEQFDWVCGLDWIPALGQSVFFIGSVFGSLAFGVLADRIGRLHCLVFSNVLAAVGNLATVSSPNPGTFLASRFIAGCATDTNFVMMYILVMEYMKPEARTLSLNLTIGLFYCVACMAVPWLAVYLKEWNVFLTAISLPHFLVGSFYLMVPESAQWLVSKGRIEEAIVCLKKVAKLNGRIISDSRLDSFRKNCDKYTTVEEENILGLLKTPKLRKKTLILVFKSMVMTVCYDAISRNVNGSDYSPYVVFTITSSTILPACLFILVIQDRIGRKALASGALLVTAVCTTGSGLVQASLQHPTAEVTLLLVFLARFAINVAYNSGAQYAVELIPTVVRGQGVSAIHVAGYAATFFSPQILYLGHYWKPFPEVILGVLLILGAVACLFLPETLGKVLPITLHDGEVFGENEKLFEFACYKPA